MSRTILAAIVATVLLPAIAHAQRSDAYTSKYSALSDHNIFMKDRGHPSTRPSPSTQSSPRDPERSVWLAGVVLEDEGFRAYVENQNVGTIARLAVGDSIARGTIAAIEIDAVAYQANGHTSWIEVGHDFANRPIEVVGEAISASVEAPATTAPSGLEGISANDPNLTMEQKLKLRRMQELKGK